VKKKNFAEIAEMIDLVCNDSLFRKRIIEGQRKRLRKFTEIPYDKILLSQIERAIELIFAGRS
jgi:hypothetical protein